MCGRFGLSAPEFSETRFCAQPLPEVQPLLIPRFNIAPSQDILTVALSKRLGGARALKTMRWGLTSDWAIEDRKKPRPINLKVESLLERPYFRRLLLERRCIIPADGFYEWEKLNGRKQAWNIGWQRGKLFGFAGVWDATKRDGGWLVSCAILTTTPNELVGRIHDRMPVILLPDHERAWLEADRDLPDLLPCLAACPAKHMELFPVPPLVNDVRNDGPELRVLCQLKSEVATQLEI